MENITNREKEIAIEQAQFGTPLRSANHNLPVIMNLFDYFYLLLFLILYFINTSFISHRKSLLHRAFITFGLARAFAPVDVNYINSIRPRSVEQTNKIFFSKIPTWYHNFTKSSFVFD